jgi:uncharacterized damage-inducible protein DinB
MITPEYCRLMARYNHWQNDGLRQMVAEMPEDELRKERGAFFGSIWATLNHLLWADTIWMSRFSDVAPPQGGIGDSVGFTATKGDWDAKRFRMDGRIADWAEGLNGLDLTGDLNWYSGALGRDMTRKKALCVLHFFNHQTHHRGQVHAMLTAVGQAPGSTDLFAMPDEVW